MATAGSVDMGTSLAPANFIRIETAYMGLAFATVSDFGQSPNRSVHAQLLPLTESAKEASGSTTRCAETSLGTKWDDWA